MNRRWRSYLASAVGLGFAALAVAACVSTGKVKDSAEIKGCWNRSVDNRPADMIDLDQTICFGEDGKASFGFVEDYDGVEYVLRYRMVSTRAVYMYDDPETAWRKLPGQLCKVSVVPHRSLTLSGCNFANTYLAPCKKGHFGKNKEYVCDVFKDESDVSR